MKYFIFYGYLRKAAGVWRFAEQRKCVEQVALVGIDALFGVALRLLLCADEVVNGSAY